VSKIPAWVDKCVESLLPDLRKRYPKRSEDDLQSSAWAICTDRYKQMKKKGKVESVPTMNIDLVEVSCHETACGKKGNYALTKGDNVSDWALPYKNCDGSINKACVRNALARLNQVQGYSAEEKSRALAKLRRAARSVGIDVKSESTQLMRSPEIVTWYSKVKVFETFTEAVSIFHEGTTELHGMQEAFSIIQKEKEESGIDVPVVLEVDGVVNQTTESVLTKPSPTHVYIRGTAIGEGTTRNLNHYRSEELRKAAPSLAGRPVQADHGVKTRDNVGKVLVSSYQPESKTISYVARIRRSHEVADAVELGDVDTVSIGATVTDVVCNICGKSRLDLSDRCKHHVGQTYEDEIATRVGVGLEFVELSVTPFPAYKQSSAGVASTHDSMDMALAVFESWKTETTRGTIKLSEQQESDLDSTMKLSELTKANVSLQNELGTAQAELEKAHDREKKSLARQIAEAEVELGIKLGSDAEKRVEHLRSKEIEALNLLCENVSDQLSHFRRSQSVPSSKGIVSSDEPERDPMDLTKEEAKTIILRMLGWPESSKSAKATVREYTRNTYHPLYSEYVSRAVQAGSE